MAQATSGLDLAGMTPKSSGGTANVLEVLEEVPEGVVAVKDENGEIMIPGSFGSVQALATRVFRDSDGKLSVRTIDGTTRVVRLK